MIDDTIEVAAGEAPARPAHVPAERVVDFDMYAPPGVREDFHRAWKSLHEPGVPGLVWTPRNGGHWIATRNPLINEVMSDYARFSNRTNIIPKSIGAESHFLPTNLDPPEHRPFRNLLNASFSPAGIRKNQTMIRELAVELIEGFRLSGHCNFNTDFADIFPIRIFLSIFGLPADDALEMKDWCDQMLRPDPARDWGEDGTGFHWGRRRLFEYLAPHVDARIGGDGEDVLSRLVNGEINGRQMSREDMLKLSVQILIAGLDTVVNFLGFAMHHLAAHPEARAELVADPALIPAAAEEMFRRFPVVTIGREVVAETELDGVVLHPGEMVAVATPLSGIDERVNDRPMEVDFHRANREHTTFGNGPHKCPGAHLARTEVGIALEEWLKRIPEFTLAPGAEITFTGGIVAVVNSLPLAWDPATTKAE